VLWFWNSHLLELVIEIVPVLGARNWLPNFDRDSPRHLLAVGAAFVASSLWHDRIGPWLVLVQNPVPIL
jgi:hypothetical protein